MKSFFRLKKRWQLVLLFCCSATLVLLSAIVPFASSAMLPSEAIAAARELQAVGQYHQACSLLLSAAGWSDIDCRSLVQKDEETVDRFNTILARVEDNETGTTVEILHNLGNVLRVLGSLEAATHTLDRALEMAQHSPTANVSTIAIASGNAEAAMGRRQATFGNKEGAQNHYRTARDRYENAIATAGDRRSQLRGELSLFKLAVDTGQNRDLTPLQTQIATQLNSLPDDGFLMSAAMEFADGLTCLKVREPDDRDRLTAESPDLPPLARQCIRFSDPILYRYDPISWPEITHWLARADGIAEQSGNRRDRSYTKGAIAQIYELSQQPERAEALTETALDLAESIRADEIIYRWQWQLGRLHDRLGNSQKARSSYHAAFDTLQALRSQIALLNAQTQYDFRDRVEPVYRQFAEIILRDDMPSSADLELARNVIEGLQIAEIDDYFRQACARVPSVSIEEIDPQAASIYTILLRDRLEIILALPDRPLQRYRSPLPDSDRKWLLDFSRILLSSVQSDRVEWKTPLQNTYNYIIAPIENELDRAGVARLVFVLDGQLRTIPMAALYDGDRYLIEKYAIAVAPGLQLLQPRLLDRDRMQVLAAGRETFSNLNWENWDIPVNDLPFVEEELTGIDRHVDTEQLFEDNFTVDRLRSRIDTLEFPVIHVATHGRFSNFAENTFILSWDRAIDLNQLGQILKVDDPTRNQDLELLVFSACQTAQGNDRAILGMAGVALQAGARTTIGTLWTVNDRSTATLMEQFYTYLGQTPTLDKAEALRQAQLDLIRGNFNEEFTRPYYWAPFVLVGNWL